jgi:hypothetical protein
MKNETTKNGGRDEHVFDIQQGVSINLMIKNKSRKNELGRIFHFDLFGDPSEKYSYLLNSAMHSIDWTELEVVKPHYFFVPKNFEGGIQYKEWFSIAEMFKILGSGVKNERDRNCQQFSKEEILKVVKSFKILPEKEIKEKYIVKDARDWKVSNAKEDLIQHADNDLYMKNLYRPFDFRHTFYTGTTR